MNPEIMIAQLSSVFDHHYAGRLSFRPLARSDAFALFQASQDPDFTRYLLWSSPSEEVQTVAQVDRLIRETMLRNAIVFSICRKPSGEWLGYAALLPFRDGVEMGVAIHPQFWNTRVVFTASSAIVQVLMKMFPGAPIYNRVSPENSRMRRICEAYGFEKVDQVEVPHKAGHTVPLDVYLLNPELVKTFDPIRQY